MTGEREEKQKQTKWHSGRSAWNKTFFDGFSDVKEGPY